MISCSVKRKNLSKMQSFLTLPVTCVCVCVVSFHRLGGKGGELGGGGGSVAAYGR